MIEGPPLVSMGRERDDDQHGIGERVVLPDERLLGRLPR
jgi:hypothetical protein